MATLDCIGVDPFVLRPPVAAECLDRTVYCPPVYRSDFVLGGVAGADVWMNLSERLLVQSRGRAVVDWYREFSDVSSVAPDVSQAVRYVGPRVHLDFGWRHVQSRRGMLAELAQRIRRTAFDRRLTCPQLSSITAMASSSEAAITQPALSAATRSSSLGVAAIQMATAEVSSCTAQHCSNVSSTNQSSSSPRAISTRFPRSTITLSSHASCRSNQRRVCCCVVLPGEVGRAVIAYTSHTSLRARCASSASPSASRTGRCSHPFCIVQGGCFHPLDAITPSMSTPTRNGSMTDT